MQAEPVTGDDRPAISDALLHARLGLLTSRQRAVYDAIVAFWDAHRYSPSIREIMGAAGYRSTDAVHRALRKLRRLELIDFVDRVARSVTVTGATWFPPNVRPPTQGK